MNEEQAEKILSILRSIEGTANILRIVLLIFLIATAASFVFTIVYLAGG